MKKQKKKLFALVVGVLIGVMAFLPIAAIASCDLCTVYCCVEEPDDNRPEEPDELD